MFQDFRGCNFCNKECEQYDQYDHLGKKKRVWEGPSFIIVQHSHSMPQQTLPVPLSFWHWTQHYLQLLQHHWSFVCQTVNRCRWLFQAVPHVFSCGCPSEDLRPDFFDIRWECRGCVHLVRDWRSKTESPIMKRGQVREILNTSKSEVIDSFLPVVCSHASIGWPDRARALSHSRAEWPSGKKTPFTRIFWTLCRFVRLQTQQRNQRKITVDASFLLSKPFLLLHC